MTSGNEIVSPHIGGLGKPFRNKTGGTAELEDGLGLGLLTALDKSFFKQQAWRD